MALGGTFVTQSKVFANFSSPDCTKKLVKNTTSPSDCTLNLSDGGLFSNSQIKETDDFYYYADSPTSPDFHDVLYGGDDNNICVDINSNDKDCDQTDLHKIAYGGDRYALRYKVYCPKKSAHDYEITPLPLVIIFHAGGYRECSDYNDGGSENSVLGLMANEFAKKGFICVLAHYRTGRIKDSDTSKVSTRQMLAAYRAMQDVEGCLRSIIKRDMEDGHTQVTEDGFLFKINTDQVFLGGLSAGSIAVLGSVYYRTQHLANRAFVSKNTSDLNIEEALGRLQYKSAWDTQLLWRYCISQRIR